MARSYTARLPQSRRVAEMPVEHYENFPVASRLLPAAMRPHVAALYAFARVADDIASGRLVVLDTDEVPRGGMPLIISAVHPAGTPPGPAGRWFIDHMAGACGPLAPPAGRAGRARPAPKRR